MPTHRNSHNSGGQLEEAGACLYQVRSINLLGVLHRMLPAGTQLWVCLCWDELCRKHGGHMQLRSRKSSMLTSRCSFNTHLSSE